MMKGGDGLSQPRDLGRCCLFIAEQEQNRRSTDSVLMPEFLGEK